MTKKLKINNLNDLDLYLKSIPDTKQVNLINYAWLEYGFYPIFFNELFRDFFVSVSGDKIGICFEGHEIFYEDLVDTLIVLEGFIDTSKAYCKNKETDLLLKNFKEIPDRGIAFWYTIRNFDENEYEKIINKFSFKNIIHPIGKDTPWKYELFSLKKYKYATGEKDRWTSENTAWKTTKTLGWNLDIWKKDYKFDNVLEIDSDYCCLFLKNTWKSRNFRSSNIKDILVGDGTEGARGFGFVDLNFFNNLVNKFINEKKYLVIIYDLVKYPVPSSEYIIGIDMKKYLDVKKLLSIVHNSKIFITSSTSMLDLAAYYCNVNFVLLDDKQNKHSFVSKICQIKNKKSLSYNFENDFGIVNNFINQNI